MDIDWVNIYIYVPKKMDIYGVQKKRIVIIYNLQQIWVFFRCEKKVWGAFTNPWVPSQGIAWLGMVAMDVDHPPKCGAVDCGI